MSTKKTASKGLVCIVIKEEASNLRSTQPIAKLLIENGYRVEYVGLFSEKVLAYFKDNNFDYLAFTNPDELLSGYEGELTREQQRDLYDDYVEFEKQLFVDCYNHYKNDLPKLVIFEILNTTWTKPFIQLGVPVLGLSITMSSDVNLQLPSVHTNYVPSKSNSLKNVINIALGWANVFLFSGVKVKLSKYLYLRNIYRFKKIPKLNNAQFFKENGYTPLWGDFPANDIRIKVPTIYCCPEEFDLPKRKRKEDIIYAGSSILINRKEESSFDWNEIPSHKENIYVTLGSMPEYVSNPLRANFYKSIFYAAKELKDTHNFIVQIKEENDIKEFEKPENVFTYSWVSHMDIFRKTSLVICHAGLGTLREAIYHNNPVIVFPILGDQPGNGARILYHNLGKKGNLRNIEGVKMLHLINEILKDRKIKSAVQEFSKIFKKKKDLQLDIKFFENLINKKELEIIQ
nr:hypothetical protein BACY1_00470 [Tenacibaculum mesophilum]